MSFCEEISVNCDNCYELSSDQCSVISIITDLIEGDTYYLHLLDKFENHYYAKINKKSDDDFMTKENKYEDYSDLAGYHFNSDISRIYKFVSPLCSVSVANEKAGKKK